MGGIPVGIALRMLRDVARNMMFGYAEPPRPTDEHRTAERRNNLIGACDRLMKSMAAGPGDFFDSDVRHEIAKEAYACWGDGCPGCRSMRFACLPPNADFAAVNASDIDHEYATKGSFRDVVHAIANLQDKLDEPFFEHVVDRMKKFDAYRNNDENADGDNGGVQGIDDGDDKFRAMAIELCVVVACCAGVRAFYKTAGILECPPLPEAPRPTAPARFARVSDYSTGPLATDKSNAWGPYLPAGQLHKDVAERYGFDMFVFGFAGHSNGPTSKASSAPTTCMEWMRFMEVAYVAPQDAPRFFSVPGADRHLNRGQLEAVAAAHNGAVSCRF